MDGLAMDSGFAATRRDGDDIDSRFSPNGQLPTDFRREEQSEAVIAATT
jgi:hypothetical protein